MNFQHLPLTDHPWGSYWALGSMAAVSAILILWLKKNKWV
jgi:Mg2+ and Co2+ transporter CorA